MTILAILLLALGFQEAQTPTGEIEARAELVPDTVRVGEVLTLTVSVVGVPENAEVVFPELADTGAVVALGPAVGIEVAPEETRLARYEIAAWQVGDLQVGASDIKVVVDAAELVVPWPAVGLHVVSVLPSDADADTLALKPPADVVGGNWSVQEKLAGSALALALLVGLILFVGKHRTDAPVPRPAGMAPKERALAALARLEESGLAEAMELKAFYSALSQTMREFLADSEAEWGLDLTTPELIAAVGADGVEASEVMALGEMLVGADLVKFARRRPSAGEVDEVLESARRWILTFERVVEVEADETADAAVPEHSTFDGDEDAAALFDELFATEEWTTDLDEPAGEPSEEEPRRP